MQLNSQGLGVPSELHVQESSGRKGGNVVSLVYFPDVHMQRLPRLKVPLCSGRGEGEEEREGEGTRERARYII